MVLSLLLQALEKLEWTLRGLHPWLKRKKGKRSESRLVRESQEVEREGAGQES